MTTLASVLWQRLDCAGHDACWLEAVGDRYVVHGVAVFAEAGEPAGLAYRVTCDSAWRTISGHVAGHLAGKAIDHRIERSQTGWIFDGESMPSLSEAVDLDLNFTPATNLLQLSRIAVATGEERSFTVAWLEIGTGRLKPLPQSYRRLDASSYAYASPQHGYEATLDLLPSGFVRTYPGLWAAEGNDHP